MATITTVQHLDDLAHAAGHDIPATHKDLPFELDGKAYVIDLGDQTYEQLCDILAPFIAAGRRSDGRRAASRPAGRLAKSAPRSNRDQNQAIRQWATRNGITVGDRGAIPANVIKAFEEEHAPRSVEPRSNGQVHHEAPTTATEPESAVPHFATKALLNRAVRDWAAGKGVVLNHHGKVPGDVMDQYVREHGEPVIG